MMVCVGNKLDFKLNVAKRELVYVVPRHINLIITHEIA